MATKIVDTVGAMAGDGRHMFTLSNGNAMALTIEGAATIKVYETSAADRKTGWTQRANIAAGTQITTLGGVTGALDASNNLHILAMGIHSDGSSRVYYWKLTYAGYSVGAAVSIFNVASATSKLTSSGGMDIDCSDSGAALVSIIFGTGANYQTATLRPFVVTTGGVAVSMGDIIINVGSGNAPGDYLSSIVALGGSSTARRFVIATAVGVYQSSGNSFFDSGVQVRAGTVHETTGVIAGGSIPNRYNTVAANVSYPFTQTGYKCIKLFKAWHADLYQLGIVCGTHYQNGTGTPPSVISGGSRRFAYHKGSWDGTTWANQNPATTAVWNHPSSDLGVVANDKRQTLGITMYDTSTDDCAMVFSMVGTPDNGVSWRVGSAHVLISPQFQGNIAFHTGGYSDGGSTDNRAVFSGGTRNVGLTAKHDTMIVKADSKPYHWMSPKPPTPVTVEPDNGQNVNTATPILRATGQWTDSYFSPAKYAGEWQIAPDNTFTTGLRTYNDQEIFDLVNFDGSNSTPKEVVEDTTLGYTPLTAGTWYIRSRLVASDGNKGDWTTTSRVFTLGHPPTALPITPLNNVMAEYGAGTKTFSWDFSDPYSGDVQTAYQLRIRTSDATGTIIYDSGKVSSALKAVTVAIPSGNKNMTLYWEVKLWDSDDAGGLFSAANTYFQMIDPATASVTAPTANQVLTNGTPLLNATVSATGARTVKKYNWTVYQAGEAVWTSPTVYGTFANAAALPYTVPPGVLRNNKTYTVVVSVQDDAGVVSISALRTFSTSWSAALSATVFSADASLYDNEAEGYVTISWTDANRESGFVAWRIYRSVSLVDPFTNLVLENGEFELWKEHYGAQAGTYTLRDYLAPANQQVNYLIRQLADRGSGFLVESENITPASVVPTSTAYWLFDMTNPDAPEGLRLGIVTADAFTDEQEESEYVVIGRGRHVDRGEYLGPKGAITVQLRDNISPITRTQPINGTATTDAAGWSAVGDDTLIRDTVNFRTGPASIGVTVVTGDTATGISDPFPAYPGRAHSLTAYVRGTGNGQLNLIWYDIDDVLISSSQHSAFSGGSFALRTINAVAPLNAVYARVSFAGTSMTVGQTANIDDVTWTVADVQGKSARQKRLALLDYQSRNAPLYLRNPFGDLLKVNVSSMQVGRIAGVGRSEFVDVTLPYSQVG
jgi:hypothetical protein